jgi:hypothetical protein
MLLEDLVESFRSETSLGGWNCVAAEHWELGRMAIEKRRDDRPHGIGDVERTIEKRWKGFAEGAVHFAHERLGGSRVWQWRRCGDRRTLQSSKSVERLKRFSIGAAR